jgi:excinuclease ABC subunit A
MIGVTKGRFSFNVKGGRCETCQGSGVRTIEMNFYLMFMWNAKHVKASVLKETLEIRFKRKVYFRCFEHDVDEAVPFLK